MIEALRKIGELVIKKLEKPHVIYICFKTNEKNNQLIYQNIELKEAYKKDNNNWIKKEAVGGFYYSPTIPLKISTKKSSLLKNVNKTLKNLKKTLKIKKNEKSCYHEDVAYFISNLFKILETNKEYIINQIADKIFNTFLEANVSKNKINIIVSLKINNETLKDNRMLNHFLFHKYIIKTFKTTNAFNEEGIIHWESANEKMVCSVCSKSNRNITAEYKPYTFYSNDKPSYNTDSNFSTNSKMFPIDIQCAYLVEIGRCYVDMNYEFSLGEETFKLIPKILFPVDPIYQQKILDLKIDYEKLIKKEKRTERIKQEEFLFSVLEDFNNTINFDIIFYEKNQAEFKILLHIKDIAPSRIKKIHNAFKEARKMGNFYRNYGNLISFYTLKRFYSRYEGKSIKYDNEGFLEMLDIIFSGKEVKKSHILDLFFSNFQNKIFKSNNNPIQARQTEIHAAILIFEVLKQLNLLNW
ncbi:MAG: TM1802 family CRISPR-associated protein [Candidatus Lokiarchaeota archaeon]